MRREPLVTLPPALLKPGTDTGARFVMGVDGGATKTLAAVLDVRTLKGTPSGAQAGEHTLHLGHGASSNADMKVRSSAGPPGRGRATAFT